MRPLLRDLTTTVVQLALATGAAAFVWLGPGSDRRKVEVELVSQRLPGAPLGRPAGPYERWVELGLVRRSALDQLDLVPDPGAERTRVHPTVPERVLNPDGVMLLCLAEPRVGRPLALEVRVAGAASGDRIVLKGETETELGGQLDGAILRARHHLAALGDEPLELTIRWEGERGGQRGIVEVAFRIVARPPPAFFVGPGVSSDGSVARALRLQGFRPVHSPDIAELFVLSLGRPAPASFAAELDRGKGSLLVAEPGLEMHRSWLAFVPVLPAPRSLPMNKIAASSRPGGVSGVPGQPEKGAPDASDPARDGKGNPRKPTGPVRPGPVDRKESDRALAESKRRQTRSVALVLLIDDSHSMQDPKAAPRIEMAKRAALLAARRLGDGDQFALITFGSHAKVVLPLGPADRRQELATALAGLQAQGSTTKGYPGLLVAWQELKKAVGRDPVRHVILLTDGDFHDPMKPFAEQLIAPMNREGIDITSVGILPGRGGKSQGMFELLEKLTGRQPNRHIIARDSTEIPEIVLGEVEWISGARRVAEGGDRAAAKKDKDVTSEPPKQEPPAGKPDRATEPGRDQAPVRHALLPVEVQPVLAGLDDVEWPQVVDFLPLEAQARTRVHLAVGEQGHAFLATGPFGLGRIAVLAGSDGPPWCAELAAMEQYPRLIAQLAAWLMPPPAGATGLEASRTGIGVLAGDGFEPGVLAQVARRLGGTVERTPSPPLSHITVERPAPAWPWILGILLCWLGVLVVERLARRRVARLT